MGSSENFKIKENKPQKEESKYPEEEKESQDDDDQQNYEILVKRLVKIKQGIL